MLRCAACHRRLLEAAYTVPASLGACSLGPKCYEKERAAGRLPRPSHFLGAPAPRKPTAKRVKIKRAKLAPQVQEDLFSQRVESAEEVD